MSLDTVHDRPSEDAEHGIAGGVYQNMGSGALMCVLECLCGRTFVGDSWAEAGGELDDHLEATE